MSDARVYLARPVAHASVRARFSSSSYLAVDEILRAGNESKTTGLGLGETAEVRKEGGERDKIVEVGQRETRRQHRACPGSSIQPSSTEPVQDHGLSPQAIFKVTHLFHGHSF